MAVIIGAYEAKTKFSELLTRVESGEEILISRRDRIVARLKPEQDETARQAQRHKRLAALHRIAALRDALPMTRHANDRATPWDLINEGRDIDV